MKKLLSLILVLVLCSFASAYIIDGNTVSYDSQYANLSVTPHTVINPHLQWQQFTVNSKASSGDLCVAYVFGEQLIQGDIQLQTESDGWNGVKEYFDYVYYDQVHIYYNTVPLHFDAFDNHTWRMKYKPQSKSGKWELWTWNSLSGDCKQDYIDGNYNFFYNLDPWWQNADMNISQGYVALTNQSFTDTFEFYNATYNFTERWIIDSGNWTLNNEINNGYGFNTTMLIGMVETDTFKYLNYSLDNYNNFEVIVKAAMLQDFGLDGIYVYLEPNTYARYTVSKARFYIDGSSNYLDATKHINLNEIRYLKFVHNNSFCSWYDNEQLSNESSWDLLFNKSCVISEPTLQFVVRACKSGFDNVLIRELMPQYVPAGDYHASFVYDSSNETKWEWARIKTYKDGVQQSDTNYHYLTDFNQTINYTLDSGVWRFLVYVQDNWSNYANNYTQYLYVDQYGIYNCSPTYPTHTLNISNYLEDWPTVKENLTLLEIAGSSWVSSLNSSLSPTKTFNFSFSDNSNDYLLCIYPPDATIQSNMYIKYTTADGFTHRYYYVNETFTDTIKNLSLYNFNYTTDISDLKITLRNKNTYSYMGNIIGKLQRHYVGEGVWRTMQMDESGDFGIVFFNIIEEDTDYKIIFVDRDNNILETSESMKFVCAAGVCDLVYLLVPYSDTATDYNMILDWDFDNTTGIITIDWEEPTGDPVTFTSRVTRETMGNSLLLCNTTSNGASGTHTCNVSGLTGTFFIAGESTKSPTEYQLSEWLTIYPTLLVDLIGEQEGAFWVFGIVLTTVMFGIFSPVGAVIAMVIGLIFIYFLGLMSAISFTFIIIACVVGVVIGLKVKR